MMAAARLAGTGASQAKAVDEEQLPQGSARDLTVDHVGLKGLGAGAAAAAVGAVCFLKGSVTKVALQEMRFNSNLSGGEVYYAA